MMLWFVFVWVGERMWAAGPMVRDRVWFVAAYVVAHEGAVVVASVRWRGVCP